jgi:hypothetical protein
MRRGSLAFDTSSGRVGVIMGAGNCEVYLRPIGGGCEWSVKPEFVRPATRAEELSAKNAAANRRSRGEAAAPLPVGIFAEPCTRPCPVCQSTGRQ